MSVLQSATPRLSRRALLGAAATLSAAPAAAATSQARPNILWLVSEDNNPYIGAYGDKLANTPTIDRLAANGVLYRNAYSTAPVCAPSRFSIITGVYAESCAPANQMRARAQVPRDWKATSQCLRDAGYYCTNNSKTDYNCDLDPAAIWDESSNDAHWRKKPAGKPFFSVFNYMTTHESQLFKPAPGKVQPDDVAPPPYLPDTPEVRQDIASYYNLMERMDGQLAARLAELEADGLADDTIIFYYSDNGGVLPRSKRYCTDEGLRVALVVYAPPRWAHLLPAKPGSEITSPVSLIDLPPTLMALAGAAVPPQMQGQPLFGSPAARPRTYAFGMRNRMDEVYDFVRSVTDGRWRYTRNYLPHLAAGRYGAFEWQLKSYQSLETEHLAGRLTKAQARFFEPRPFEELYDLQADPAELNNLAQSAPTRGVLLRMREALDSHMLAVNDNGFIPEGSPLEGFEASRVPGAYPLPRIMALAALAGEQDPANLPRFRAQLGAANEVMRFWAALGIAMLGPAGAGAVRELRVRIKTEPSPQVRVALAEAIGASAPKEGAERLGQMLDQDIPLRVKLQALNGLNALGGAAAIALPSITRVEATAADEYLKNASKYLRLTLTGQYRPSSPIFDMEALRRAAAG